MGMTGKPLLGIMTLYGNRNKSLEELSYFKQLAHEGRALGLDVFVFTPEDVLGNRRAVNGLWLEQGRWVRRVTRLPDLVYDRCRYQATPRFRLMRAIRRAYPGLLYLNQPLANKWEVYRLLRGEAALARYQPDTRRLTGSVDIRSMLDRHRTIFIKPINGTGGRGIVRVRKEADGRWVIQGRSMSRKMLARKSLSPSAAAAWASAVGRKAGMLVQQGIEVTLDNGRVHDFRLLVQKDGNGQWTFTGGAGRIGPLSSITSNLHGGGRAERMERLLGQRFRDFAKREAIKRDMRQMAFATADALERKFGSLCELALDVAVDRSGKPWLLEVNPKPAREVFRRLGEIETYRQSIRKPLEYALWLHARRSR